MPFDHRPNPIQLSHVIPAAKAFGPCPAHSDLSCCPSNRREVPAPDSMDENEFARDTSQVTVMFVEDEESLAETYATFLQDDYAVKTANSGSEALEKIDDIDIVFLDRRMPGLSGDEVLDRIVERDLDCRVAMLSAIEPDFEMSIGYDEYLTKPVTKQTLHETVEELLVLLEDPI